MPDLQTQLEEQRRKVDFDTFDVVLSQLLSMLVDKSLDIAPVYQRQFRWDDVRCSQLIESILLGIPVPSLFMATNPDGTWELVDGVQRISTIVKYAGEQKLRDQLGLNGRLRLTGLEKLTHFNGLFFAELPQPIRLQFERRPVKVVTLSDKSDTIVRFDLFERLNRGGVILTDQEIRDCVYRGEFSDFIERMSHNEDFAAVVRLTRKQQQDGTRKECVLRFFAFLHGYRNFVHSVVGFLNEYMYESSRNFNYSSGEKLFVTTFRQLAKVLPDGIKRPQGRNTTPLNLFEGVAVGAALALRKKSRLSRKDPYEWMGDEELRKHTIAATNNVKAVTGRIQFCRDRFLGK